MQTSEQLAAFRALCQANNLGKSDVWQHKQSNNWIISRPGIEKIQGLNNITVGLDYCGGAADFAVVKATATRTIKPEGARTSKKLSIESLGSANDKNSKVSYYAEMAEKRAKSRAILMLMGFYALGVYGEDEADDFKRRADSGSLPDAVQAVVESIREDYIEAQFSVEGKGNEQTPEVPKVLATDAQKNELRNLLAHKSVSATGRDSYLTKLHSLSTDKAESHPELADDAAEALGNLLSFATSQLNVGKNLNDGQLAILVGEMLERYWHWRFDEFALVLKGIAGRYSTTYDRLDAPTVHGWCLAYEAQRNERIEAQAQARTHAHRLAEKDRAEQLSGEFMPYFYLRAKMEALPDADLVKGIAYYRANPQADGAEVKRKTAERVLAERTALVEADANRGPSQEEAEVLYRRIRADYYTDKLREQQAQEAADTGAELCKESV